MGFVAPSDPRPVQSSVGRRKLIHVTSHRSEDNSPRTRGSLDYEPFTRLKPCFCERSRTGSKGLRVGGPVILYRSGLKSRRTPHLMLVQYASLSRVTGLFIIPCQHPEIRVSHRIGVDITF